MPVRARVSASPWRQLRRPWHRPAEQARSKQDLVQTLDELHWRKRGSASIPAPPRGKLMLTIMGGLAAAYGNHRSGLRRLQKSKDPYVIAPRKLFESDLRQRNLA